MSFSIASSECSLLALVSMSTSCAVPKKRTVLPAWTHAFPTAIARCVLPRPVWPWNTKSCAESTNASDMRSSAP